MTIATMKDQIDKLNAGTDISFAALVAAMRGAVVRGGLVAEATCGCVLDGLCVMECISREQLLVARAVIGEETE